MSNGSDIGTVGKLRVSALQRYQNCLHWISPSKVTDPNRLHPRVPLNMPKPVYCKYCKSYPFQTLLKKVGSPKRAEPFYSFIHLSTEYGLDNRRCDCCVAFAAVFLLVPFFVQFRNTYRCTTAILICADKIRAKCSLELYDVRSSLSSVEAIKIHLDRFIRN